MLLVRTPCCCLGELNGPKGNFVGLVVLRQRVLGGNVVVNVVLGRLLDQPILQGKSTASVLLLGMCRLDWSCRGIKLESFNFVAFRKLQGFLVYGLRSQLNPDAQTSKEVGRLK